MSFDRDWMRASLDLFVLSVLAEGANYGYMIQKRIREISGNQIRLPGGTLYPLLHRLEALGAVTASIRGGDEQGRRWYELTSAGRRRLSQQADQWRRLSTHLSKVVPVPSGHPEEPQTGVAPA